MIEIRTSRSPEAACGVIAAAAGREGWQVKIGTYGGVTLTPSTLVWTRIGPTFVRRAFTGVVRADGAGSIVTGQVQWEPGYRIGLFTVPLVPLLVTAAAFGAASQRQADGVFVGSLGYQTAAPDFWWVIPLVAFVLVTLIVWLAAVLFRYRIRDDDERRLREALQQALSMPPSRLPGERDGDA